MLIKKSSGSDDSAERCRKSSILFNGKENHGKLFRIIAEILLLCLLIQMIILFAACSDNGIHTATESAENAESAKNTESAENTENTEGADGTETAKGTETADGTESDYDMEDTLEKKEISVNGVSIYYEKIGRGKPVILVHGNGGSHADFANLRGQLANAGYLVYTPDSRGQGNNAPLDEYHYADMAEDMYQFIKALGIEKPALYGWSDGGIIGLILEIEHPSTLSVLAISGANITPEGAGFSENMIEDGQDPLYQMMLLEPHLTTEQLSSISVPVLVTAGEYDVILPEHTKLIADSLPDSELVIEEGEDHGSYIINGDKIGSLLIDFFERKYR